MEDALIFKHMQAAVDIVNSSQHPTSKVAANLVGRDLDGYEFSIVRTNGWPQPIKDILGTEARIGNSSGSIHAETQALLESKLSQDAAIFITDLPCPNCVKNMAEAGVRKLFIDHKGFEKDFAQRRGHHFDDMSMKICEKAGVSVTKVFRKDGVLTSLFKPKTGYTPAIEKPAILQTLPHEPSPFLFQKTIAAEYARYQDRPFALGFAQSLLGKAHIISAEVHPVLGYTSQTIEEQDPKYSYLLQPVNRVLMTASRFGLKLIKGYIFSSRIPTPREMVNLIGAQHTEIHVGDLADSRDAEGLQAMHLLEDAGILGFRKLN
jgi:dCMP deaminase